jgi:hypothetical protein
MSKKVKMIFPVPLNDATRPLVEAQLPPAFCRPDIEVAFVSAGRGMTLADSYYDMALMEMADYQHESVACLSGLTIAGSGSESRRGHLQDLRTFPGPGACAEQVALPMA